MKDYEKIEALEREINEMKKIKVDEVVVLTRKVCKQHLKPLKLDYDMYWITSSIWNYCISGNSSELRILRFLVSTLWWNGYKFDGDCIMKLTADIVSAKARGLIEE